MKPITGPGTAKIAVLQALQTRQRLLGLDGGQVKDRMHVVVFTHDVVTRDLLHRIQRHHHRLRKGQRLQHVEQVMQANAGRFAACLRGAFVVPGGPGEFFLRQHRRIGVQHGAVGLVADGAQYLALRRAGLGQQGQRLVGMRGQHDLVKMLDPVPGGDAHAASRCLRIALNVVHGGVQALVADAGNDFVDIVARPTLDGPPLRPVGDLDQAVVVAEADHGRHRELQHLVDRAGPDAAHHGQEIPVAKLG